MNIIELAKKAGISSFWAENSTRQLERFATFVRAEALEEAAKVCDELQNKQAIGNGDVYVLPTTNKDCAAAIRGMK